MKLLFGLFSLFMVFSGHLWEAGFGTEGGVSRHCYVLPILGLENSGTDSWETTAGAISWPGLCAFQTEGCWKLHRDHAAHLLLWATVEDRDGDDARFAACHSLQTCSWEPCAVRRSGTLTRSALDGQPWHGKKFSSLVLQLSFYLFGPVLVWYRLLNIPAWSSPGIGYFWTLFGFFVHELDFFENVGICCCSTGIEPGARAISYKLQRALTRCNARENAGLTSPHPTEHCHQRLLQQGLESAAVSILGQNPSFSRSSPTLSNWEAAQAGDDDPLCPWNWLADEGWFWSLFHFYILSFLWICCKKLNNSYLLLKSCLFVGCSSHPIWRILP